MFYKIISILIFSSDIRYLLSNNTKATLSDGFCDYMLLILFFNTIITTIPAAAMIPSAIGMIGLTGSPVLVRLVGK